MAQGRIKRLRSRDVRRSTRTRSRRRRFFSTIIAGQKMKFFAALRAAPSPVVMLGFVGLIPFAGLSLLVAFVPVP